MAAVGAVIGTMAPGKMATGVRITTTSSNGRSVGMTPDLWLFTRKDMIVRSIIALNMMMESR